MDTISIITVIVLCLIAAYQWIKRLMVEEELAVQNKDLDIISDAIAKSEKSGNIYSYRPKDIRIRKFYNNYVEMFLRNKVKNNLISMIKKNQAS